MAPSLLLGQRSLSLSSTLSSGSQYNYVKRNEVISNVAQEADFEEICVGRQMCKLPGSLRISERKLQIRLIGCEYNCGNFISLDKISAIDLQTLGLSETTSYMPLRLRLTLEFSTPLSLRIFKRDHAQHLISFYFTLDRTRFIYDIVKGIRSISQSSTIQTGIPSWAPWIPQYSPVKRLWIQRIILVWTICSVLWAIWQLYHHFRLLRDAVHYIIDLMYLKFRPTIEFFQYTFGSSILYFNELIQNYTDPLHVIFVSISTPIFKVLYVVWNSTKSFYSGFKAVLMVGFRPLRSAWLLMKVEIFQFIYGVFQPLVQLFSKLSMTLLDVLKPVQSIVIGIINYIFLPFLSICVQLYRIVVLVLIKLFRIWQRIISSVARIGQLSMNCIQAPFTAVWDALRSILTRTPVIEASKNQQEIEKIKQIAQKHTRAVAIGLKNLSPNIVELKNNLADNLQEVRRRVTFPKVYTPPTTAELVKTNRLPEEAQD